MLLIPVHLLLSPLSLKMGQTPALLCFIFVLFTMQRQLYNKFDSNDKSVDGVLGTRTRDGGMMEGAEL